MQLGGIARGANFFDRKRECADLWRYLETDHVVVTGPRRLGKSSIVCKLCDEATTQGFLAKYIDVQDIDSAQGFIDEIARNFPDKAIKAYITKPAKAVFDWLNRIKSVQVNVPTGAGGGMELAPSTTKPWSNDAHQLKARLSSAPLLILIDEFSVFLDKLLVKNRSEAEALLSWLRAWRLSANSKCRFLFSGSIGLNALLQKYGLSAQLNDCYEYPIQALKPDAASQMMVYFAKRSDWSIDSTTIEHISTKIGWLSPFFVCLMLDKSKTSAQDRMQEQGVDTTQTLCITKQDVDDAYQQLLASSSRFVHWHQRLQKNLEPPEATMARKILASLARTADGLKLSQLMSRLAVVEADADIRSQRLSYVLEHLREEGYLSPADEAGKTRFLSFLLRDYWHRNHG